MLCLTHENHVFYNFKGSTKNSGGLPRNLIQNANINYLELSGDLKSL